VAPPAGASRALDRLRRESLLAELETLDQQIKKAEGELNTIGAKDWRVALLRTIPGVGPRTAEAVAAYIDDPGRFTSIKSIGKYFGIVPMQDASAGKNRLGHITREGPATVRKLIVQRVAGQASVDAADARSSRRCDGQALHRRADRHSANAAHHAGDAAEQRGRAEGRCRRRRRRTKQRR
jgi:transposase